MRAPHAISGCSPQDEEILDDERAEFVGVEVIMRTLWTDAMLV
jgi:hypothetical protein